MPLRRRSQKLSRLDATEVDENFDAIARPSIPVLTISNGIITIPSVGVYPAPGVYYVLPESGTADNLTQINGALGQEEWIMLRTATVGHIITVIHTPSNLLLATDTFLLNSIYDAIAFRSRATNVWVEETRNSIAP